MRSGIPSTHIILVGILPRAGWTLPNKTGYPNRFSTPTDQANAHIQVRNSGALPSQRRGVRRSFCKAIAAW